MKRIPFPFPRLFLIILLGTLGLLPIAFAQENSPQPPTQSGVAPVEPSIVPAPANDSAEQKVGSPSVASGLVIGPGDDVEVTVYGAPDLSGHLRVSANGNVSLPLIGYVRVAGLSSTEAEAS